MERKQTIGGIEHTFKFTNRTFMKLDELYENGGEIYNGVITGEHHVSCSAKLVAVSCTDCILTENDILDKARPEEFTSLGDLANNLIFDYMGISKSCEGKKEAINESQNKKK